MTNIIAVLNQKGGVGKTTTTLNIGAYLAKRGSSVLIVDLDPQGNATSGLGIDKLSLDTTTYDLLFSSVKAHQIVKDTGINDLSILPSNPQLAAAEVDLANESRREFRLKDSLNDFEHDYILIDCPPSLGLLSINALTCANYVLVPVQTEYYAMEGLGQLLDIIQRVKSGLNPRLELLGIVMTMFDSRTSLSQQVVDEVKKHFGPKLLDTIIPRNVRLAEAPSFGKTILEHDKWSKGARSYKSLAKEIESRVKK